MTIRLLTRADGPLFQKLRLESLGDSPQAFMSTLEAENKLHEDQFGEHLDWAFHPPHFGYFGLFIEDQLVGYVQAGKTFLEKQNHVAQINNLYITPNFRGKGLAKQLVQYVLDQLRASEKVERVYLSCTATNKNAFRFYRGLGFQRYAVRAKAIKWQDKYDDEIELVKVL